MCAAKEMIMKAYELYVAGRKACWNTGAGSFEEAQVRAAVAGMSIPDLTGTKDLSPKELRKLNRMRKYLGG